MSFIKSLFKSENNPKSDKPNFPWKALENENQIAELIEESNNNPVAIFKHSTRCGISRMVIKQFEKQTANTDGASFYYLDLLQHRNISNALASTFEITHQSPQLILLKNGKVAAHDSHNGLLRIEI
ncbi:MAG: bacillithiol system redox-active protein YtxJ [Flavobacteriales bacterium]|jgi:bacillithiol system protein YtxJ|nr:bacillithiol system redox-active protein YtxJ [Flavobacteriales bacterium]